MKLKDPLLSIDEEIKAFNDEESHDTPSAEPTIQELIRVIPENKCISHIHAKVILISTLYHARVRDKDYAPLTEHIAKINHLDARLDEGDPTVVDEIWHAKGTSIHYPSFATKFCNWHNQKRYAIYDLNAWESLIAYGKRGDSFHMTERDWSQYADFLAIVKRFQNAYGLTNYSLKDIDKFLWRVGRRLLEAKEASKQNQVSSPSQA